MTDWLKINYSLSSSSLKTNIVNDSSDFSKINMLEFKDSLKDADPAGKRIGNWKINLIKLQNISYYPSKTGNKKYWKGSSWKCTLHILKETWFNCVFVGNDLSRSHAFISWQRWHLWRMRSKDSWPLAAQSGGHPLAWRLPQLLHMSLSLKPLLLLEK